MLTRYDGTLLNVLDKSFIDEDRTPREGEVYCGKIARFQADGYWLCAEHWDEIMAENSTIKRG